MVGVPAATVLRTMQWDCDAGAKVNFGDQTLHIVPDLSWTTIPAPVAAAAAAAGFDDRPGNCFKSRARGNQAHTTRASGSNGRRQCGTPLT